MEIRITKALFKNFQNILKTDQPTDQPTDNTIYISHSPSLKKGISTLYLAISIVKLLITLVLTVVLTAYKKLVFLKKIFGKDPSNICKKAILEEVSNGMHGLAYECKQICRELELPDIMGTFVNKNRIKSSIFLKMNEKALEDMSNSNKVSDRLTDNLQDDTYIHCLSLPQTRIWIRYRDRAIAGVKANFKQSHSDLTCRFCSTGSPENQEHLEICGGTDYERRGLDMSRRRGILTFWRRMTMKLMEASVKKKRTEVTHQQNQ